MRITADSLIFKACIGMFSFVALTLSMSANANHMSEHSVEQRLAPIGSVCVVGEDCKSAEVEVIKVAKGPRSGKVIYVDYCASCHATGIMKAPKSGTDDWAKLSKKGISALVKSARKGKNAMPPKGGCGDCSNKELEAAIQNMIDGK